MLQKLFIEPVKKLSQKWRRGRAKLARGCNSTEYDEDILAPPYLIKISSPQPAPTGTELLSPQLRYEQEQPTIPVRKSSLPSCIIATGSRTCNPFQPILNIGDEKQRAVTKTTTFTKIGIKTESEDETEAIDGKILPLRPRATPPGVMIRAGNKTSRINTSLRISQAVRQIDKQITNKSATKQVFIQGDFLHYLSLRFGLSSEYVLSPRNLLSVTTDTQNSISYMNLSTSTARLSSLVTKFLDPLCLVPDDLYNDLDKEVVVPKPPSSHTGHNRKTQLAQLGGYRFKGMLAIRGASSAITQLLQEKEVGIQYWAQITEAYHQLKSAAAQQVSQLQEDNSSLHCQVNHLGNHLKVLRDDNSRLSAAHEVVEQYTYSLSHEICKLQSSLRDSMNRESQYQASINALTAQAAALNKERDALENEKSFAEWNAEKWEKSCNDAEEELEIAENKIGELEQQLEGRPHYDKEEQSALEYLREKLAQTEKQRDFYESRLDASSARHEEELRAERKTSHALKEQTKLLKEENTLQKEHTNNLLRDHQERFIELSGREQENSLTVAPDKIADAERCVEDLKQKVKEGAEARIALFDAAVDLQKKLENAEAKIALLDEQNKNLEVCARQRRSDPANSGDELFVCQHQGWLLAKTKELVEKEDQIHSQAAKHKIEMAEKDAEVHKSYNMLMQEQAESYVLQESVKDRDAEIKSLEQHRDELVDQLATKAFGEHKEVLQGFHAATLEKYEQHFQTYSKLLNERDFKIDRLVQELSTGELIIARHEDLIAGLKINNARSEAIVKAVENRFAMELRMEPLTLDLRPYVNEFSDEQMDIIRQVDGQLYQLVGMDVAEQNLPDWMM